MPRPKKRMIEEKSHVVALFFFVAVDKDAKNHYNNVTEYFPRAGERRVKYAYIA